MRLLLSILFMAYTVNPKIHHFETAVIRAAASHLFANGITDPKKQRDEKELATPRVELQLSLDPYGPTSATPHVWIRADDKTKWPDTREGKLYVKVFTRRGAEGQDHAAIVGTVRSLFQSCSALSSRMELHKIERIIEGASLPEVVKPEHHDVTVLTFDLRIRVLFGCTPNETIPNPAVFIAA